LLQPFFGAQQANTCGCGASEGCAHTQIGGFLDPLQTHIWFMTSCFWG